MKKSLSRQLLQVKKNKSFYSFGFVFCNLLWLFFISTTQFTVSWRDETTSFCPKFISLGKRLTNSSAFRFSPINGLSQNILSRHLGSGTTKCSISFKLFELKCFQSIQVIKSVVSIQKHSN